MAAITYPVGVLFDDAGAILTAPVVTIAYVKDPTGADIATPGVVVNGSGSDLPISIVYDAETHGEAWVKLNVTQAGHTITGWNAAPVLFCAKDSGRIDAAISSRAAPDDILSNAANKLVTNGSGQVLLNMTQSVPITNTAQTVGDALNAARAVGFGKWVLSGTTLTLYAADGSTVIRTFSLAPAINPTSRV